MTKLMTVPKVFDKVFENRKKGEVLTTSLKVAEVFGIEHKNVLRDIRKLLEKRDKITKLKFELSNKFAEPKSRLSDSLHIYDSVYNALGIDFMKDKSTRDELTPEQLSQIRTAEYMIAHILRTGMENGEDPDEIEDKVKAKIKQYGDAVRPDDKIKIIIEIPKSALKIGGL